MDCNLSMQYLIGNGDKTILHTHCPTIAGSTKVWARVRLSESEKKWCLLPGWVLMRLVGYPGGLALSDDSRLMSSFAGNAFSAFTIGPVLMGFFATSWNNHL